MNTTAFEDVMATAKPEATLAQLVEVRNLLTNAIGLVCNSLALVGIVRHNKFSRQFKVHVSSIAVADLSFNVCLLMISAVRATGGMSYNLCLTLMCVGVYFLVSNPMLVLVMAFDRFYAVFSPIKYRTQRNATLKAVVRVILAMATAVPVTFFAFYGGPDPSSYCYPITIFTDGGLVTLGLMVVMCACVVIAIYIAMACKMTLFCRCWSAREAPLSVSEEMFALLTETSTTRLHLRVTASQALLVQARGRVPRRTYKLTVQSAVLVGWFCISYMPFGFYIIYIGASETVQTASEVDTTRFVVLTLSPFLNAILDPFIFFWHLGGLKAIGLAIRRCFRGQGSNPESSANTGQHGVAGPQPNGVVVIANSVV